MQMQRLHHHNSRIRSLICENSVECDAQVGNKRGNGTAHIPTLTFHLKILQPLELLLTVKIYVHCTSLQVLFYLLQYAVGFLLANPPQEELQGSYDTVQFFVPVFPEIIK